MPFPRKSQLERGESFLSKKDGEVFEVTKEKKKELDSKIEVEYDGYYENIEVSEEAFVFLKELEKQMSKEKIVKEIKGNFFTLDGEGNLIKLDFINTSVKTLPKLPITLNGLSCFNTPITELPELPENLRVLFISGTPLSKDEKQKKELEKYCKKHNIRLMS